MTDKEVTKEETAPPSEAPKEDAGGKTFVPTDPDKGLTDDEVLKQREIYGVNEIPAPDTPLYVIFLRQFIGFLPLLIEAAAIVALAVQDWVDFAIIAGKESIYDTI